VLYPAELRARRREPTAAGLTAPAVGGVRSSAWRAAGEVGEDQGATDDFLAGGGLELDTGDNLPVVSGLTLNGAVFVGEGVFGWTVGLGAMF
jgi:hypothetical protein